MHKRQVRPIRVDGDIAIITLTKGYEAVIDAADVHLVDDYNWRFSEGYARTCFRINGRKRSLYLHRLIMSQPHYMQIDHADCNPLNNRRSNLRLATNAENGRNRGACANNKIGLKGVSKHHTGRWRSRIKLHGKETYLGLYATPEAAHDAYVEAAKRLHGEFHRTA